MRTISLLPFAALVALAAGCGSDIKEGAAHSVPQRDLTLETATAQVEVASPVEIHRPQVQHRTVRHTRLAQDAHSRPLAPQVKVADVWAPVPVLVTPRPVAQAVSTEAIPANDRELLPGKTVTVIPASSGPSIDTGRTDQLAPVRRGGHCGGRAGGGRHRHD